MTNPCSWFLHDLDSVPKNGFTAMTTFSCGGGSSMGYRRAGFDVIAANDIDPVMAYHYKYNLKPKHYYLCPIKDLLTMDLPDELFHLDILGGVAQTRQRVFFTALRNDIDRPLLKLNPTSRWISAGEACEDLEITDDEIRETALTDLQNKYWNATGEGKCFDEAVKIYTGKSSWFDHKKLSSKKPSFTLKGKREIYHWAQPRQLTFREFKRLGSFPDDYYAKSDSIGKYMVGMSVPPLMTEAVARAVAEQWLAKAPPAAAPSVPSLPS
jgi:DNA (cytosine-5)-methyltransferase 1